MNKSLNTILVTLLLCFTICCKDKADKIDQPSNPKLTVVITVDQLGQNVLTAYRDEFKHGLKTLMEEGLYFENAVKDHAVTNSLPGHTSIATGMWPKNHGITDNVWSIVKNDSVIPVQPMVEGNSKVLGADSLIAYEPKYIQTKALPEFFKEANSQSKIAIVGAGRSAALHMGNAKGLALWYEPFVGRFITSTAFDSSYPEWVNQFNSGFRSRMVADTIWDLKYSKLSSMQLPEDARDFEHRGENFTFPHISSKESDDHNRWYDGVPSIDRETTNLAIETINQMQLGQDTIPDFLSVTYSMIDEIGHQFGPFSLEQYENLMMLDEHLGELIAHLNTKLGQENYTLVLTADHGAVTSPEQTIKEGGSAYRISSDEIQGIFRQIEQWEKENYSKKEMEEKIVALLEAKPFIANAFTQDELNAKGEVNDTIRLYQNSHIAGRTPIFPIYGPGWSNIGRYGITVMAAPNTSSYLATSIHGTPYPYDVEVPIIFYGKTPEFDVSKSATTIDIAPTLLKMNDIKKFNEMDGKPLF